MKKKKQTINGIKKENLKNAIPDKPVYGQWSFKKLKKFYEIKIYLFKTILYI